jgi:starch synthase
MDLSSPHMPAPSVLFVAPECAPLSKTGGLGDVCGALPAALRGLGVDVRVLMPGYPDVLGRTTGVELAPVSLLGLEGRLLGARPTEAGAGSEVPLLVVECPALYARRGGPYQDEWGDDWSDNALRFAFLSKVAAVLGSARSPLRWRPQVVHCHDWPGALAAVYLHLERAPRAATLLTIHNLAYQGNFEPGALQSLRLPRELYRIDGLEFYGRLSFLKGGIVHSDAISTVSPSYAREIQTPEQGCGMDGLLRQRRDALSGILNGIDTAAWDPASDPHLAQRYDARSLEGRAANKEALQRRFGLAVDPDVPLAGMVGRLTQQKGVDLVAAAADALAARAQVAILGKGERELERAVRAAAERHPGRIAARISFDEPLAHLVEGGADLFLMPSRFEPCGLNQMYSQRYGTPPLARATGGLSDSIEDGKTGFLFSGFNEKELMATVERALALHRNQEAWRAMQRAAMARDFSWDRAARRYADLYLRLATPQPA